MENKQEIQEYRKFFESVFDRIPGMIYVHDMVNDVNLYRSWSLKKLLGYEESPILKSGIHIRSLVHPNDAGAVEQAANQMLSAKDDECVSYSYRMKHQDGHWLWFRSEEYVYARDKQGKPSVVLGYATEITASVNQQQELDEINKVNQLLLNAAQILSRPDTSYHSALNALAKEVSENLNVVCDISILETETGIIKPEAVYHFNPDVKAVVEHLFSTLSVKKGQGLVGSVIETGKEIVITDVPESMRRGVRAVDELIVPQSIVYLPITGADSVLGALSLTRLEGESAFTEVQIEQIRRLGKYLSLFVENRLLKERQEHNSELREQAELTLENEKNWADFKVEVSTFLADVDLDLTTAMLQFAEKVAERFNAVCAIQLVNDERDEILMVALHHPNKSIRDKIENSLQRTTLQVGKGLVGKVVSTGREYVSLQLPKDLEKMAKSGKVPMEIMPSSIAYLPLNGQHGVLGTLSITTLYSEKNLSETDINQLRDLALHTARFIENRVLQIKQNGEIGLRRKAEKRLERAGEILKRKEAETRSILNTIPINIARISRDFRYQFLNDAYWNMGVDPKKMEGKLIKEIIGEIGFRELLPLFEKALKGETVSYDFDGVMADGLHRYFNVALAPDYSEDGEITGFYSCASEVTSKVIAEKEAKLTQERLDSLSLNSGDAFFFHDMSQQIIDVNEVAVEMLGYSREELLSMKASMLDPRWRGRIYNKFLDNLEVNVPQTFDTLVYHKDGHKIPAEVRFVKRKEGDDIYIQSLIRDRTEKREQERRLQQSEERLRLIFENVEDYIATVNENGEYESINSSSRRVGEENLIGESIYDLVDSEERLAELKRRFQHLKETKETFEIEDTVVSEDGSTHIYNRKFIGIFHRKKFLKAILIIRDITAEKNREYSIMNAVLKGQEQERKRLGAELHDGIGQIMSAIALQVSQITEEASENNFAQTRNDLNDLTSKLQAAIREVRNISHDLMPEVLESFGLKEAINQTCNNLEERAGLKVSFSHADIAHKYDTLIEVNLFRITQELLTNVQKHAKCKGVFVSLIDHGTSLSLTVEDDGIGFNLGQGNEFKGIGLSNVYSRVSMMDGQIDVESSENAGTLVNIEVPKKVE